MPTTLAPHLGQSSDSNILFILPNQLPDIRLARYSFGSVALVLIGVPFDRC